MCRYLVYVVWCAAAIALFINSLLLAAQQCQTSNTRRLSIQSVESVESVESVQPPSSAFALLTNSTPVDHDLVVAIRCDMVHQDETFDICNPSSIPTRSSSIVQRDARSYDRIMSKAFMRSNAGPAGGVRIGHFDTVGKVDLEEERPDGEDDRAYVPLWMLIALTMVTSSVVIFHTAAIALSTSYLEAVMHAPAWLLALLRILLASLTLLVSVLAFFTRCGPHLSLTSLAIAVYLGCLLEPYGQSMWIDIVDSLR